MINPRLSGFSTRKPGGNKPDQHPTPVGLLDHKGASTISFTRIFAPVFVSGAQHFWPNLNINSLLLMPALTLRILEHRNIDYLQNTWPFNLRDLRFQNYKLKYKV